MELSRTHHSVPIYINFTYKAKTELNNLLNGISIREFLTKQSVYHVQIEKDKGRDEGLYLNFYFSSSKNEIVQLISENRTLKFSTVLKDDGFLVISTRIVQKRFGDNNVRRLRQSVHFVIDEKIKFNLDSNLQQKIDELPIARERSKIVMERLRSWEVYLDLLLKKAEHNQADIPYHSLTISTNLREVTFNTNNLQEQVLGKRLRSSNAILMTKESLESSIVVEEQIGIVRRIDSNKNRIVIELDEDYVDLIRKNRWIPKKNGTIKLNNYGDLSQAKRLKKGFKDLENGLALNPNLEFLLFDEHPISNTSSLRPEFKFDHTLRSNLNTYQKDAVKGALEASDLYLIQGPPGTGKTTVIAEICYQNAIQGLKTLVASQSNLAVDNALSKLLEDSKIRILRKGRTNSIEEEGKKFIEENVAFTWKNQTQSAIKEDINRLEKAILDKKQKDIEYKNAIKSNEKYETKQKDFESLQQSFAKSLYPIQDIKNQITIKQKKAENLYSIIKQHQQTIETFYKYINSSQIELNELADEVNIENKKNFLTEQKQEITKMISYKEDINRLDESKRLLKSYTNSIEKLLLEKEETEKRFKRYNRTNHSTYNDITKKSQDVIDIEKQIEKILNEKTALQFSEKSFDLQLIQLIEPLEKILKRQEEVLGEISYDVATAKEIIHPTQHQLKTEYVNSLLETCSSRIVIVPKLSLMKKVWNKVSGNYSEHYEVIIEDYTILMKVLKRIQNDLAIHEEVKKMSESLKHLEIKHEKKITDDYVNILGQINNQLSSTLKLRNESDQELQKLRASIEKWQSHHLNLYVSYSLPELFIEEERCEKELSKFEKIEESRQQLTSSIRQAKIDIYKYEGTLKHDLAKLEQINLDVQNLTSELESLEELRSEAQAKLETLKNFLDGKTLESIEKENRKLKRLIRLNNVSMNENEEFLQMKQMWSDMLESAKEHDLEEIRRLYIKHANVIGITCVQSARPEFVEEYPDFDVVIIDEVSKATPPELLLPMLKGKKIILVGDHHQLPPLVGQETLEEVASKEETIEQQEALKNRLKESLFERLFNSLDDSHKQTLRIQYRMHETIMKTISQFYEGPNHESSFGLSCGILDSDVERDHFLDGHYIKRGQHLMWFDLPNEADFFEHSESGSTSKYNKAELNLIRGIIEDLEVATANAKAKGLIDADDKKQVGIISFYGDQIQRIKKLVDDEIRTEHLIFRIGTVDRFQGMESDIILASFVRNHQNPQDDIGFLNEYRRLNVALSRAKELLIITGSSAMFTRRAKNSRTRTRFKNVLQVVKNHNGLRDYMGRQK
ncbi:AAA domain-containing protein [Exiguobacterium sp. s37]|uniref:AAA domain-containing protein n=1 Tax=Exiguobacterium sp. s37 TaxID=2751275 RepID=UPI001BE8FF87